MNVKRFIIICIAAVLVVATLSGCRNETADEEPSAVKNELPAITSDTDGTVTKILLPQPSEQPTTLLSPSRPSEQTREATESSIYAAALVEFVRDTMGLTASVQADLDDYVQEGGTYQFLLYSMFIQDSNRTYMVIIDKVEHDAAETITHYITNYEINGKDVISYIALKEELSEGIWLVTGESRYYDYMSSVKVYNSDTRSWPEDWWSSQETFEDNIFTIILNNESRMKYRYYSKMVFGRLF